MQPYFATTEYTTAASAVLNIMKILDSSVEMCQSEEFRIWQKTTILPTRASSVFALAKYAKEKGLNVKVIAAKEEYDFPDYRFYRYSKADVDSAKLSARLLREEAINSGVPVEIRDFDLKEINSELKKGNILLLRLNVKPIRNLKRNSSNYIIIKEFDGKNYNIIDTGNSAMTISCEMLQECFETLESKKHRDHRMIVFSRE
ncbi:hypothetical protein CL619_01135 [archaeon]|nr:hypothetical protein [archaeon]|tara:strand:+ start:218 stop:823 length:606 start_codon:yes stop_codon:yes gene_type:complete